MRDGKKVSAKNKEREREREDRRGSNHSDKVISLSLFSSSGLIIQSGLDLRFSCPMYPSDEYYIDRERGKIKQGGGYELRRKERTKAKRAERKLNISMLKQRIVGFGVKGDDKGHVTHF